MGLRVEGGAKKVVKYFECEIIVPIEGEGKGSSQGTQEAGTQLDVRGRGFMEVYKA